MKYCKCKNPMVQTPKLKYGRFSDNEHPLSPIVWFCNCGETTEVDSKEYSSTES